MQDSDAKKLLTEFKKDAGFRDRFLSDPEATAKAIGIALDASDVASIRNDAAAIRKDVSQNSQAGVLVPTLVKIIKWTP